jgi:hypothetical protein
MIAILFCLYVISTPLQQTQPLPTVEQEQQRRDEERRMEEEARRREAEERAREQQRLDQLQEDMLIISRTVPMTPEEIEAARQRLHAEFVKTVAGFDSISAQIGTYASRKRLDSRAVKDIRKKAKTLEDDVDEILEYLLDGSDPPDFQQVDYGAKTLAERVSLLKILAPSLHQRIRHCYVDPKVQVIDANEAVVLMQDLQSMKVLTHSLRQ